MGKPRSSCDEDLPADPTESLRISLGPPPPPPVRLRLFTLGMKRAS